MRPLGEGIRRAPRRPTKGTAQMRTGSSRPDTTSASSAASRRRGPGGLPHWASGVVPPRRGGPRRLPLASRLAAAPRRPLGLSQIRPVPAGHRWAASAPPLPRRRRAVASAAGRAAEGPHGKGAASSARAGCRCSWPASWSGRRSVRRRRRRPARLPMAAAPPHPGPGAPTLRRAAAPRCATFRVRKLLRPRHRRPHPGPLRRRQTMLAKTARCAFRSHSLYASRRRSRWRARLQAMHLRGAARRAAARLRGLGRA